MKIKDLGEIELIKRLSKRFRLDGSVIRGSGDDTAVLRWTKEKYLLFACDMVIEDAHFTLSRATPFQIGWKALGRNISDIAAMGGVPKYAVVSMGIDPALNISVADGICEGLRKIADRFGVNIVGGDIAKSKKIIVDIAVIGQVEKNKLTLRSGAKKGDIIFVTGTLGGSIKGKHLKFEPRLKGARWLVDNFKINSMIDISDGLALDLHRILKASNVGAIIAEEAIPVSKEAKTVKNALFDGEDYELLFTMNKKEALRFLKTSTGRMKTQVSMIGKIAGKERGFMMIDPDGRAGRLKTEGYTHF